MTVFVTIIVAVIGAAGGIFSAYMISRTTKQDRVLNDIKVTVNGRLDKLLAQTQEDQKVIAQYREEEARRQGLYGRRKNDRPDPTVPPVPPVAV